LVNRRVGEQVAAGASVVVLYDVFKGFAQTAMPNLPLSGMGYPGLEYYNAGTNVGEYSLSLPAGSQLRSGIVQPMKKAGLGEYVMG
jgi:hypothetical protein